MTEKQVKNSPCKDVGHWWRSSTASNFRTCQRKSCYAVQIYKDGLWVDVTRTTHKQQQDTPYAVAFPGFDLRK